MFKKICMSVAPMLLLAAVPVMAQEVPQVATPTYNCDFEPACEVAPGIYGKMASPVMSKFKMSIGGFVKLDYAHNSTNMGAAIPAMGSVQRIAKSSSPAATQDQSIFTARQSRIWFKVAGPTFLGAQTGALLETDFYGASGATDNQTGALRLRLALGTLDWKNTQLLFGQAYDIFGPAVPSTIDFGTNGGTGAPSSPRVAQIRVTHKLDLGAGNALQLIAGVQNAVQNSNGTQSPAVPNNSWGDTPNVAGQAMFTTKALGVAPGYFGLPMRPLTLGAFGLYGRQQVLGHAGKVDSWGYGAYTFVPILKSADGKNRAMTVSLEGQAYLASNMLFNGATGNATTGAAGTLTEAKGFGYYGQLIFFPTQQLGLTAGYSKRQNYDNERFQPVGAVAPFVNANFEKYNSSAYANISYDLNAAVRVAVEYQHLKTKYGNTTTAAANTGNLTGTADSGINNVGRLAFFYFF